MSKKSKSKFLMCVKNDGYPASLEVRKVYQVIPDDDAAGLGFVRIVDESGEDYLFPSDFFVAIDLPKEAATAFAEAS